MPGGPAKTLSSIPKVVIEGMVKPVADQFGQAIEQGVNDTFGTSILPPKAPPKPVQQNPAQKMDEDRRRQNILRYFDTLKANSQTYRQQQEEALNMRRNQELEKKQKIQQFQFEKKQKKQESVEVYRQQRKTEMKVKTG